jgi:hypothetical protein
MLELTAQDPDRRVLDHWLANPRVTEADVVRLAASRPVATPALEAIYESDRGSVRASVRVALAYKPLQPSGTCRRSRHGPAAPRTSHHAPEAWSA